MNETIPTEITAASPIKIRGMLNQRTKKITLTVLFIVVVVYGFICFQAYSNQSKLLYHPEKDIKKPRDYGMSLAEFFIQSADGTKLRLWYRLPKPNKPVMVFFHGNAGHIGTRIEKFKTVLAEGYGVLAFDYRGFGGSEGEPTEEGIYADARAAIQWVLKKGVKAEEMFFYGESLGTAVAVQMATEFPNVRVVGLESPFTSMAEVGKVHYPYLPVSLLLKDKFDSMAKIKEIKVPVVVMHGEMDDVVPVEQGKKLFDAANEPKKAKFYQGINHHTINMGANLIVMHSMLVRSPVREKSMNVDGKKATSPVIIKKEPIYNPHEKQDNFMIVPAAPSVASDLETPLTSDNTPALPVQNKSAPSLESKP